MAKTEYKNKQMRRAKYHTKKVSNENKEKDTELTEEEKLKVRNLTIAFQERFGYNKKVAEEIAYASINK
jgi:hypothetical protein